MNTISQSPTMTTAGSGGVKGMTDLMDLPNVCRLLGMQVPMMPLTIA